MAVTWTIGGKKGTTEFAGATLVVERRTVQVMSDVWESWMHADVWDGEKLRTLSLSQFCYRDAAGNDLPDWAEGCKGHYETAPAFEDATPEVRDAVEEWQRVNFLVANTRKKMQTARKLSHGKEVEVVAGRKVPRGPGYEICGVGDGRWDTYVNLRDKQGKAYRYVSPGNVRLVDPTRYCLGPVACEHCRKEFETAKDAGMDDSCLCRDCKVALTLEGMASIPLPKTSKQPHHDPFVKPEQWAGDEAAFIKAIAQEPEDTTLWLVWADWIEEKGQLERSTALREALVGKPRKSRKKAS